jgi:hypothetical protein
MKLCAIGVCFSLIQYLGCLADNRGGNVVDGERHGVLLLPSPNTEPRESHRRRVPAQPVYLYSQVDPNNYKGER